jgi:hypothetical protein
MKMTGAPSTCRNDQKLNGLQIAQIHIRQFVTPILETPTCRMEKTGIHYSLIMRQVDVSTLDGPIPWPVIEYSGLDTLEMLAWVVESVSCI